MFANDTSENGAYWTYAKIDKIFTEKTQGTGIYQCYCSKTSSYELLLEGDVEQICYNYVYNLGGGYAISTSISIFITVINLLIKTICIFLI